MSESVRRNLTPLRAINNCKTKIKRLTEVEPNIYIPPHRRNKQNCNESINEVKSTTCKSPALLAAAPEPPDDIHPAQNKLDVIKKILDLAQVHLNIGFKAIVKEIYEETYSETLPKELLEALTFQVMVDTKKTMIVTMSDTKSVTNKNSYSTDNLTTHCDDRNNNEIKTEDIDIPNIEVKEDVFWISLHCCESTAEVFGSVIMDNDEVEKLSHQMKIFYTSKRLIATQVIEGKYYAVFDGSWHRVKCIKVNSKNALVYFIDRGDEDVFKLKRLHTLDRQFYSLSKKAVKMSLSGLEIFKDCDVIHNILDDLMLEKKVIAKVVNKNEERDCFIVELFKKKNGEIVNINDHIFDCLCKTVLNPRLNIKLEENIPAHVSLLDQKIFIKLETKTSKYFDALMKEAKDKCFNNETLTKLSLTRFEVRKIYFVKSDDGEWYRAKILKSKNVNMFEVFLVDFGYTIDVKRSNIISLEKLSNYLARYPAQAIEVRLAQLSSEQMMKAMDRLHILTSVSDILYVKFSKTPSIESNAIPPEIQLFKKTSSNYFISINDALLIAPNVPSSTIKLKSDTETPHRSSVNSKFGVCGSNFISRLQSRLKMQSIDSPENETHYRNVKIGSLLNPPDVPIGSFFDVHVLKACSPSRFVIQLLRSKKIDLTKMMSDLYRICEAYKGPKLQHNSIKVGQLYACKANSSDLQWYRVYVIEIIDIHTASVYLCDYGNYIDIEIENLVPLENRFYELPYQAIWAELHGVLPKSGEWTEKECSFFKDIAQSKNFVCLVKGKKCVEQPHSEKLRKISLTVETVYSLELIDTSKEEDFYIADFFDHA